MSTNAPSKPPRNPPLTRAARAGLALVERELGGREETIERLASVQVSEDKEPRLVALMALLADPANAKLSVARICKLAAISVNDYLTWCRDGATAQGMLKAQIVAAESVEAVMRDVVEKSVDQRLACSCILPRLDNPQPKPDPKCKQCWGRGFIVEKSSFDHQEMVMRITGLIKDEPKVSVQQNVGVAFGKNFADSFVKKTDEALTFTDVTPRETLA